MRATIKDVATLAGVSTATVSMVLNNKAEHITQKTKDAVRKAARQLEYQPNYTARSLVSSESYTIGLIVPDIANPFFSQLAKEIEACLSEAGYVIFLCNSAEEGSRERRYINELAARSVDGMFICGLTGDNADKISMLKKHEVPHLILDNRLSGQKNTVKIDNYAGGKMVGEHLLQLGHEIVAFVGTEADYQNIWDRYVGFAEVMTKAKKQVIHFETVLTKEGGSKVAEQVFASEATAVFCANDLIAVGIYEQANKHGLQLPEDLSIVGFDDISFSEILVPKLTTVRQPLEKLAETAVSYLLKLMKNPNQALKNEILPVELIVRQSTTTP